MNIFDKNPLRNSVKSYTYFKIHMKLEWTMEQK